MTLSSPSRRSSDRLSLAISARLGCAVGAAAALLLDWESISAVFRRISIGMDIKPAASHPEWPIRQASYAAVETAALLAGGERAVKFGFQTLLAQHFAFWNIIQTRAG